MARTPRASKPYVLGGLDQSGQVRTLTICTNLLPQSGDGLSLSVVSRHHRQTRRPTIIGVVLMDDRVSHGCEWALLGPTTKTLNPRFGFSEIRAIDD